ncbi:helix-turn-helix transcriptional regulator [Mycobacterium sp. 29Ha]|uniref:helix-turn-helix domain-containing protein n=1 Tax=Mycobacterium sp. 29Ha TaxID=2939268 RepID=UPI002938F562|nr:helix-turn-helix transcriptional regulator [Mycobacterium sp. 29Ha]MDV3136488.1 helix-turn-helix domain-containing protein [Mycobacterium sp. 29Ha]
MSFPGLALADVIGTNARELRINAGLTLDQVSRAARARGLKWSESRVADFEAGRVASPSINTLLAFVLALSDAGCTDATLPGLVESVSQIQINDSLRLFDSDVVNLFAGQRVERATSASDIAPPQLKWKRSPRDRKISHAIESEDVGLTARLAHRQGATEERMSKALNIAPSTLAILSADLWRRTFTEERDRRAGEDANAQKRGQVSRAMQEELRTAIQKALDGYRK